MNRARTFGIVVFLLIFIFGGTAPPNKHGTMECLAAPIASDSNAEYEEDTGDDEIWLENDLEEKEVYIATDSNAIKIDEIQDVYLMENTETLDLKSADMVAVRVPAVIKMDCFSTESDFDIMVTGTLEPDSVINIVSDNEFVLDSLYKTYQWSSKSRQDFDKCNGSGKWRGTYYRKHYTGKACDSR